MENQKVTITEVAKWANISITTVSHYLNNTKKVSANTTRRIQAAIDELNYIPNANARSLKQKRTHIVGVVIPDMVIYSSICQYIEAFLYDHDYNVIICNSGFNQAKEHIQLHALLEQRVDGIILASSGQNSRFIQTIKDSGTPIVLFDRYQPDLPNFTYVLEDSVACIERLTGHVIARGHKTIAYMKGPDNSTVSEERFELFQEILDRNKLKKQPEFYYSNCMTKEDCMSAYDHLLAHRHEATALITTNANQLKYFIMAAHAKDIRIPEEMSFTGFGIEDYKTLFEPPITCIIQNHYDIAKNCADCILELMEKAQQPPANESTKRILLESEFFIGNSVLPL